MGCPYTMADRADIFNRVRKAAVLAAVIACLPLLLAAQVKDFGALYEKYSNEKGVKSNKIGKVLLAAGRATRKDIPKGMDGIATIHIEDRGKTAARIPGELDADVRSAAKNGAWEVLSQGIENDHSYITYGHPSREKDVFDCVILYVTGEKRITLMQMSGRFEADDDFIKQLKSGK